LRESEVRVKSAALNRGGEGVFIAPPQKLAVVEVLCAYRNFRPVHFQTAERGLSETTQDLREGGSELPTLGRNFRPSQKQLAEDLLSDKT
jgi:hypothetical protein